MSKSSVTRIFLGGALSVLAGGVLAVITVAIAIANHVFIMNGSDIVGLSGSPMSWSLLVIGILAAAAILAGMIVGVAAWIAALVRTWELESKRWFLFLLAFGIVNLGFIAMVAYLVAGPADAASRAPRGVAAASAA